MDNDFNYKQNTIIEAVSNSELDNRKASPLAWPKPKSTRKSEQPNIPEGVSESADEFGDGKGTNLKPHHCSQVRNYSSNIIFVDLHLNEMQTDTSSQLYTPPSKRARIQRSASGSQRFSSGTKNKYTNDDLLLALQRITFGDGSLFLRLHTLLLVTEISGMFLTTIS